MNQSFFCLHVYFPHWSPVRCDIWLHSFEQPNKLEYSRSYISFVENTMIMMQYLDSFGCVRVDFEYFLLAWWYWTTKFGWEYSMEYSCEYSGSHSWWYWTIRYPWEYLRQKMKSISMQRHREHQILQWSPFPASRRWHRRQSLWCPGGRPENGAGVDIRLGGRRKVIR